MFTTDAQQANFTFLVSQTAHIESQVYRVQYPTVQYPALIPVDTSANEWATTVTYYSADRVGEAGWVNGNASDIPLVGVTREQHNTSVRMAAIGYGYNDEEINQARLAGVDLTTDKADAARRAAEEFVDNVALRGDSSVGFAYGLINASTPTRVDAANNAAGTSRLWSAKTGDEIIKDINDALTAVWSSSLTTELADTVLLSPGKYSTIANQRLGDTAMTLLDFLSAHNTYTAQTGQPLMIRAVRGLETAGSGGTQRMVVYRRIPDVLKLHMPMRHRFLPVWRSGPMTYLVPGIMRMGGLDIRRPGAVRYVDGI